MPALHARTDCLVVKIREQELLIRQFDLRIAEAADAAHIGASRHLVLVVEPLIISVDRIVGEVHKVGREVIF